MLRRPVASRRAPRRNRAGGAAADTVISQERAPVQGERRPEQGRVEQLRPCDRRLQPDVAPPPVRSPAFRSRRARCPSTWTSAIWARAPRSPPTRAASSSRGSPEAARMACFRTTQPRRGCDIYLFDFDAQREVEVRPHRGRQRVRVPAERLTGRPGRFRARLRASQRQQGPAPVPVREARHAHSATDAGRRPRHDRTAGPDVAGPQRPAARVQVGLAAERSRNPCLRHPRGCGPRLAPDAAEHQGRTGRAHA